MSDDPSILSRWSARKRAVAAEAEAEAETPKTDEEPDENRAEELETNRLAAEAIDLDSLDKDSDLGVFLRDGVPDVLRKAALQKVWRSNPVFANLDELVDYGEDFGRKDLIMETFTSAWQAGRGYLKSVEEATAEPQTDKTEVVATPSPNPADPPKADDSRDAEENPELVSASPVEVPPEHPEQSLESERPASRRSSLRTRLTGGTADEA